MNLPNDGVSATLMRIKKLNTRTSRSACDESRPPAPLYSICSVTLPSTSMVRYTVNSPHTASAMNAGDWTCFRNVLPDSSRRAPNCGAAAISFPLDVSTGVFRGGGERCPAHTFSFVSARYTIPSAAIARNSERVDAPASWMSSRTVKVTVDASNEQLMSECTRPK